MSRKTLANGSDAGALHTLGYRWEWRGNNASRGAFLVGKTLDAPAAEARVVDQIA
jgi:hypothetical protein